MPALAEKMHELNDSATEETVDNTAEETTEESTEAEGGDETTEAEGSEEGSEEASAKAEGKETAEEEETEPESKKKANLFMSPQKDQPAAKAQPQKKQPTLSEKARNAIVKNTRDKVTAEFNQKFGWASDITPQEGQQIARMWQMSKTQPLAVIDTMIRNLANNPLHRQGLINYLNDLYKPQQATKKGADDPMPGPDSPNGYTAEGLKKLHEWQERQILAKVKEQVAPLMNDRKTATDNAARDAYVNAGASRAVNNIVPRLEKLANGDEKVFNQMKTALQTAYNKIARPWAGLPNEESHPQYRSESELLLEAFYTVTQQRQQETAQKKWVAEQRKKAGVNTVNPTGTTTGTTTEAKPKTFKEALQRLAKTQK